MASAPRDLVTVRSEDSPVAGFAAIVRSDAFHPAALRTDPLLESWSRHLRHNPLPPHQRAIFVREALAAESGESPSEVLAAIWIESKRLYIELRPGLGRTYCVVRNLDAGLGALSGLGFRHAPGYDVDLGGVMHYTLVLDFGPGSIDGWLGRHLALELGADEDGLLDVGSRSLRVEDHLIGLSKLEFALMQLLVNRPNQVVSRAQLLQEVWGIDYVGGSNVVDVVIRSLRRKLGPYRNCIETAHGVGYRFIPPE